MIKDEECCIHKDQDESLGDYWDKSFNNLGTPNWVELDEPWVMKWVRSIQLSKQANIFCAGVGDANIVQALLDHGYQNIIANDVSKVALDRLASSIDSSTVTYLHDDLIHPSKISDYYGEIDLYIDRATLHFFTTCPEKDHYFKQVNDLLKPNAYSALGVFSKDNRAKCCGLDLQLWSLESLKNRMANCTHVDEASFPFKEINGNVRNYIYLLSQKGF